MGVIFILLSPCNIFEVQSVLDEDVPKLLGTNFLISKEKFENLKVSLSQQNEISFDCTIILVNDLINHFESQLIDFNITAIILDNYIEREFLRLLVLKITFVMSFSIILMLVYEIIFC